MTATQLMVDAADSVCMKQGNIDKLIVSGHEVNASVILVVSAARVKQVPFSKTQGELEKSAYNVTDCTKVLVKMLEDGQQQKAEQVVPNMTSHEYKTMEMEQQVKILGLEKTLQSARQELGNIRKQGYHD